jgi:hypothetical protein
MKNVGDYFWVNHNMQEVLCSVVKIVLGNRFDILPLRKGVVLGGYVEKKEKIYVIKLVGSEEEYRVREGALKNTYLSVDFFHGFSSKIFGCPNRNFPVEYGLVRVEKMPDGRFRGMYMENIKDRSPKAIWCYLDDLNGLGAIYHTSINRAILEYKKYYKKKLNNLNKEVDDVIFVKTEKGLFEFIGYLVDGNVRRKRPLKYDNMIVVKGIGDFKIVKREEIKNNCGI